MSATDDMNDRHGRSPTSGIIANAMHPEARIDSLTPPDRISVKRVAALPVTWEDVREVRGVAGAMDRWLNAYPRPSENSKRLNALADRLEVWLREQEREAA